jgi:hypothetical protein
MIAPEAAGHRILWLVVTTMPNPYQQKDYSITILESLYCLKLIEATLKNSVPTSQKMLSLLLSPSG